MCESLLWRLIIQCCHIFTLSFSDMSNLNNKTYTKSFTLTLCNYKNPTHQCTNFTTANMKAVYWQVMFLLLHILYAQWESHIFGLFLPYWSGTAGSLQACLRQEHDREAVLVHWLRTPQLPDQESPLRRTQDPVIHPNNFWTCPLLSGNIPLTALCSHPDLKIKKIRNYVCCFMHHHKLKVLPKPQIHKFCHPFHKVYQE